MINAHKYPGMSRGLKDEAIHIIKFICVFTHSVSYMY